MTKPKSDSECLRETLGYLYVAHPNLFNMLHPMPLKIGIQQDLLDVYRGRPGLGRSKIQNFLKWWTKRGPYLKALDTSPARYDLQGEKYELADEHRPSNQQAIPASVLETDQPGLSV